MDVILGLVVPYKHVKNATSEDFSYLLSIWIGMFLIWGVRFPVGVGGPRETTQKQVEEDEYLRAEFATVLV